MPRKPDMPCSKCGRPMLRSAKSAAEPVCRPCRAAEVKHGTLAMYDKRRCRCDECRAVKAAAQREYVAQRRNNGNPVDYARRVERICEHCGEAFGAKVYQAGRFCSTECAKQAQIALRKTGTRRDSARKWRAMSPVHHDAIRRAAAAAEGTTGGGRVFIQGACVVCGDQFLSAGIQSRYCSRDCRMVARPRSKWISGSNRIAIYLRDDWTCQICGERVDRHADPLSDWYPSLDHIVPRSHGGTDDADNLRTAHRWCNSVRGDLTYYTDAVLALA